MMLITLGDSQTVHDWWHELHPSSCQFSCRCNFLIVLLSHLQSIGPDAAHLDWQPTLTHFPESHLCWHTLCHLICSSLLLSPGLCTLSLHLNWEIIMQNVRAHLLMWQWDSHKHTFTFAEDKSNLTFAQCINDLKWGNCMQLKVTHKSICSEKNVQSLDLLKLYLQIRTTLESLLQCEVFRLQAMASICYILEVYIHVAPCCIIVASRCSHQTLIHR